MVKFVPEDETTMVRIRWACLAKVAGLSMVTAICFKAYFRMTMQLTTRLRPLYFDSPANESAPAIPSTNFSVIPDNNRDIHWFVHVTDLHISKFHDPRRTEDFRGFCRFLTSVVNPTAIIVTGDITDAKEANFHGSGQIVDEWSAYHQLVQDCRILSTTKWLDLRGNHDVFGVVSHKSSDNYFRDFSVQGQYHPRSYMETIERKGKTITFVAVDATPTPGLKRLFNFFGVVAREELELVKEFLSRSKESDYSIVFGHYPTAAVFTFGERSLRDLLNGRIYLCGHYHTAVGYVHRMYTRHANGLLELELGDWKDFRKYRIFAFDQGFLAFVDQTFHADKANVAIIVTKPKSSMFIAQGESLVGVRRSEFVRVLVFSDTQIHNVRLLLPGTEGSVLMTRQELSSVDESESPLFTAPWKPMDYGYGLHTLKVQVTLEDGSKVEEEHVFSLDGTQRNYDAGARFFLMVDLMPFTLMVYCVLTFFLIIGLTTVRIFSSSFGTLPVANKRKGKGKAKSSPEPEHTHGYNAWCSDFAEKLCCLVSADSIFKPLAAFLLYMSLFPWAICYVLKDRLGVIFIWGIFLLDDWTYSPPDLTFFLGVFMYVTNVFPFIWILSQAAQASVSETRNKEEDDEFRSHLHSQKVLSPSNILWFVYWLLLRHFGFCLILLVLFHNTWAFSCMYGTLAGFGPWGVGRIIFDTYLYTKALNLSPSDFKTNPKDPEEKE